MPRLALPAALLAALALPPVASAAPAAHAEGRVETDEAQTEILGRPLRAGQRIELPEGFLQVEEEGTEDGEVGSFTIVPAEALAALAPSSEAAGGAGDPAATAPAAPPCGPERSAYLAQLWKESGIEVSDPAALLEGLQGGATGPASGFYWFALQTDPFRPLAWSSELRSRADALARCVRGG
jgi:hypothetical protein